jgi:ribonuclease T2
MKEDMRRKVKIAWVIAALLTAGGAWAEPRWRQQENYTARGAGEPRDTAGVFDYYVLSLSWSPSYCAGLSPWRSDPQCARRFAFVLHGLWPQFERGWPQDCASPDRGYVPRPVATRMRDIMPSAALVFHAYRKHGTCTGLGVDGYFDLARQLFAKVRIPGRFQDLVAERTTIAPNELIEEFVASNPGLTPQMIAVSCGGPGQRLREVRICFAKDGAFRACGKNENQRRLCAAARMYVPPVRLSARQRGVLDGDAGGDALPPGPRNQRRD